MRRWFVQSIVIAALAAAVSPSASPAAAQAPPSAAQTIDVWTAVSLGFADLGQTGGLAGQFALSTAVDRKVITLRAAGAGEFGDHAPDRGYADVALLFGKRIANPEGPAPENRGGTTASISLGAAWLHFSQPSIGISPGSSGAVPAIAFDADILAHLRVVGIGASVFGAAGMNNRYLGVGATLALGKIH
jgi:hypothetical protein